MGVLCLKHSALFLLRRDVEIMNEIIEKEEIKVEKMIYEIRGKQVILDSDLAKLYECANGTKTINLAVKRHIKRFPERFMFQLTKEEIKEIFPRFQIETLNASTNSRGKNIKYLPYAARESICFRRSGRKTDCRQRRRHRIRRRPPAFLH